MQKRPSHILPLIILSQFAGTSLWFAGNAILPDIQKQLHSVANTGNITSIVQFGFITGTFVFAIFSIADRIKPTLVFFISALVAALANLAIVFAKDDSFLFSCRFITGFFLAGIYPVGMKIAADWYEKGLGKALGWLVGALVLGTAFPHLLRSDLYTLPWKEVLYCTSAFAFAGGLLMLWFVGDGPFRKKASRFQPSAIFQIFRSADFRSAAFGYFGHMWELYTFWAFVPLIIQLYSTINHVEIKTPLWSFLIIAIGSISCVAGGYIAQKIGSSRVAFYSLLLSAACCICSFLFFQLPPVIFLLLMFAWGITVISDSPQFSALVAQTAIVEYRGTALTIVTCIGFAITIASIQFLEWISHRQHNPSSSFIFLAAGPLMGLIFLYRLVKKTPSQ